MKLLKDISKKWRRICAWADRVGNSEGHELSLADEIFAIFAGFTLFVSSTEWLTSYPRIIFVIIGSVSATVIAIIVAINQTRFLTRLATYGIALVFGFGGIYLIMEVSHHDLATHITKLRALPVGLLVWMLIREASILILNRLRGRN